MPGRKGSSTKVSKNQVVWARCHFAGLASGMDCTAWSSGDSGAASASVLARTALKRAASRDAEASTMIASMTMSPPVPTRRGRIAHFEH